MWHSCRNTTNIVSRYFDIIYCWATTSVVMLATGNVGLPSTHTILLADVGRRSSLSAYNDGLYVQQHSNRYWPAIGFQQQVRDTTAANQVGECSFSHARPATWNSLPPDIRAAASPPMFKKLLKTHFFNTAFSTC